MELNSLIKSQQSDAAMVKAMMEQPGWDILTRDLEATREKLIEELVESTSESDRIRLQGEIKGINKLLKLSSNYAQIET